MVTNPKLTHAVHFALVSTATAAASLYTPEAISQDAELEQIVVTGSRIRRVDAETASPVFTMDRGTIESSGVTTMGELVQQVPAISGSATNPAVNNGGGTGASTVELRGLDAVRTLVLLNGRRVGAIAQVGAVDINILPVNLVERVEVLKEGAGAVYGSDAIGGVVNFITRKDLDGLELGYDYGVSNAGDGDRQSVSMAWGMTGDKGNFLVGANYNKQDAIFAGDRKFSKDALYLYSSIVSKAGSSRVPNGRISFHAGSPNIAAFNCDSGSVIKKDGVNGTSLADYRCFQDPADRYNYQPINLIITPQERISLFTEGNFHVTDTVDAYLEYLHSETNSGYKIAELPFDAKNDNILIPANNYYNPFGEDFGVLGSSNGNGLWRLQGLGQRRGQFGSRNDQIVLGVKGKVMESSWTWDLNGTYATSGTESLIKGYLVSSKLKDAFGASFLDPGSGNVVCGTPGNIIAGCTPVNIFDINSTDPAQVLALNSIKADYNQSYNYGFKNVALDFAGDLFSLPGGMMQAAIGFGYTKQNMKFETDTLSTAQPPDFLTCGIAQEACSSDTHGSYDVKEVYGELLVPILKDVPAFQALNLTLGTRYSDYNTFGNTTNSSIKLEWRPINDLLVRGSYAEVFRSPTINDLFGGRLSNSATFADPCRHLTQAMLDANPNLAGACINVVPDGTFNQQNAQISGLFSGNPDLKPETGDVLTYGLVYDPSWANGLSMNIDFWKYKLDDVITSVDVNTTADICTTSGDPTFCSFIQRGLDGQIIVIQQPTLNFGKLETSGVDVGVKYALRDTGIGSFQFVVDATYIDTYDSTPCPTCDTAHVAGTFDRQYGNYAEWRALGSIGWGYDPFNALLSIRYIDSLKMLDGNPGNSISPVLSIPSKTYLDLTLGYTFFEKLTVTVGVDNLTDEQPPLLYQNNTTNANTDVSTYDTIGMYWRAGVKYKF